MVIAARSVWSLVTEAASLLSHSVAPSNYPPQFTALDHRAPARVLWVQPETATARTLTLYVGRAFPRPEPGQSVAITTTVNGHFMTRSYAVSSSPESSESTIEVTVEGAADDELSRLLATETFVDDYLTVAPPEGEFVLPTRIPGRLLFVTEGAGIVPVMSMLRALAASGEMPDVEHIHFVGPDGEFIFRDELERLADSDKRYHLHSVVANTPVTRELVEARSWDWTARETWASGSAGMISSLKTIFTGRRRQLHLEVAGAKHVGDS